MAKAKTMEELKEIIFNDGLAMIIIDDTPFAVVGVYENGDDYEIEAQSCDEDGFWSNEERFLLSELANRTDVVFQKLVNC